MERQVRDDALRRLRSIEGHIRAIQRMLEEERCCADVVRQTLAVKRALDRVSQLLVASHLRSCLCAAAEDGVDQARERTVREWLDILELSDRL